MRHFLISLLTAVNILGCTTIDMNSKVADWPPLRIEERFLEPADLARSCAPYVGFGEVAFACTEWDFDEARITSYYPLNPPQWLLDHERLHQQGYDHMNSTYMKEEWEEWKEDHRKKYGKGTRAPSH